MKYVKAFDVLGIETAQIPCIELNGAPNAATKGAVGLLGIDITSSEYELYKCVKVEGSVYTWMSVVRGKDGTCITKAEIDINGELVLTLSDGTTINVGVVKGEDGADGVDGSDGVSVTNTEVDDEGNLIVTLSNDETINAGKVKGEQGVSVVKMELTENKELVVTLSNDTTINLGIIGVEGLNGTTFTPSVDSEGYLSWTNDGGLENPEDVKVSGHGVLSVYTESLLEYGNPELEELKGTEIDIPADFSIMPVEEIRIGDVAISPYRNVEADAQRILGGPILAIQEDERLLTIRLDWYLT